MELENKIQNGVVMSIEEHNNLMNEVKTLKQSVQKLEQQLCIKNDNDIQIFPITEDEMKELIYYCKLTLERVKLWLLNGGDLMIKDNSYGDTILHSASLMGQLDIIEYVLNKGVDINCLNNFNLTPLISASKHGQIEVINYLLDKGANINCQNKNGWSALHYACVWNQFESAKLLVEHNIDFDLKSNNKETALEIAKHYKRKTFIDYLKSVIKEKLRTDYENKLKELD